MKVLLRVVTAAAVALAMSVGTAYAVTPTPSKVNSLKATAGDTQVTSVLDQPHDRETCHRLHGHRQQRVFNYEYD